MAGVGQFDGSVPQAERESVTRTVAFLTVELRSVDPISPAGQLYAGFLEALELVFPGSTRTQRSD